METTEKVHIIGHRNGSYSVWKEGGVKNLALRVTWDEAETIARDFGGEVVVHQPQLQDAQ